jgi:hypothetical protein
VERPISRMSVVQRGIGRLQAWDGALECPTLSTIRAAAVSNDALDAPRQERPASQCRQAQNVAFTNFRSQDKEPCA